MAGPMMVVSWEQAAKIRRGWELFLGADRWYPVLATEDFSARKGGKCGGCETPDGVYHHGFHLIVDDGDGPAEALSVGVEDFMTSVQYRRPLNMPRGAGEK